MTLRRQLFANNARSQLAANITNSQTSCAVASGDGSLYPNPGTNEYFRFTLKEGTNIEICECTVRAGDNFTTIQRAMEGTTAHAFTTAALVDMRDTKETLQKFQQRPRGIGMDFDGAGSVLSSSTGTFKKRTNPIPYNGTIYMASIITDISGSITFGVKKCQFSAYPGSLTDITGGANLVLSSADTMSDTTLTGWTLGVAENDVFEFTVLSVSGVKSALPFLTVQES